MRRIGVDVGGTFTDLIFWDDTTGELTVHKTASTPGDLSLGTMRGIAELCAICDVKPNAVNMFFHGTTVATNTLLEHTGAEVGLITTEGFRDILHIGRKKRPFNFSSHQDLPWQSNPLVRRRHRLTVPERISAQGKIIRPLDLQSARTVIRSLRSAGLESIAVCFLSSYSNSVHEDQVRELLQDEFPEAFVSVSSEIAPQYREYERFSTTALNAYIAPTVSRYLRNLAQAAASANISDEVRLMSSAGGVVTSQGAATKPVSLLMSGPVAGLIAGRAFANASGYRNVITLDVGGTSADIGVAPEGSIKMKHLLDTRVGGYDALVPMADVETIGAGGGSIAFIDVGGMFRVGPRSAGADPGPSCYGNGGTEPTSTDAFVALGWLRPESFLGGGIQLDSDAAREAIKRRLADPLGASIEYAANGVFEILSHAMSQAVSLHSVRKGYDPRDFVLVAQGGAGPLFGWAVARQLGIPRVVVPCHPGIASAMGLLSTDMRYDFSATVWVDSSSPNLPLLEQEFQRLTEAALDQLLSDGLEDAAIVITRSADCRYLGQGYELRVPVPTGPITSAWVSATVESFKAAHERTYSQRFTDDTIQIVNICVTGVGTVPKLTIPRLALRDGDASGACKSSAPALFPASNGSSEPVLWDTPVYERVGLAPGNVIYGPAIVEQFDSTTIVGPGQQATVDTVGHLIIEEAS